MSLLKQPWFLIFLMLMGVYSYSALNDHSRVSFSLNEARAGAKKKAKKGSKISVDLKKILENRDIDTLQVEGYESMDVVIKGSKRGVLSLKLEGKGRRYQNSGEDFSDWLEVRVSNGILQISPAANEDSVEFSDLFKGANDDLKLTIRFPKGQKFSEVAVRTISGDVTMKRVFAKDIHLKSVSGDVNFQKISCKNLAVEAVSSDLDMTSIFASNVEIKTVSGDATITSSTELPRYSFKSVSGDLDLKLPKTAQVDVNFKSMTGELINQFTKKSETAGTVEVSSMSGDAEITKL